MNQNSELETSTNSEPEMGLLDHLAELRKRLLIIASSVLVFGIASFIYSEQVFYLLTKPFYDVFSSELLIGTGPAEAFVLKIKVAIFCGVILASPIIFLQIWAFISPGLYEQEKRMVIPFVFVTTLLFLVGAYFCYSAVLPVAFEFFKTEYKSINITPTIRISEHISLIMQSVIGFGTVFEMPVIAFFLERVGIIDHKMLISGYRYAIVAAFVIGAILTPPDVYSQFLMAIPLLGLYGLSILVVKYTEKKPLEE